MSKVCDLLMAIALGIAGCASGEADLGVADIEQPSSCSGEEQHSRDRGDARETQAVDVAPNEEKRDAISDWISDLEDVDPEVRIQAAKGLAQMGRQAAPAAKSLMESIDREKDPRARREILRALVRTGPAARPALQKLMQFAAKEELAYDDYVTFIEGACNATDIVTLVRQKERAVWWPPLYLIEKKRIRPDAKTIVPAIAEILQTEPADSPKTEQAVLALPPFNEAAAPAVDGLIHLLKNRKPKSSERPPAATIIDSLPYLGKAASSAVPEMLRFKDDPKCVKSIAIALPYITDDANVAVPALIHLLERNRGSNLDDARLLAVRSLGEYGRKAAPALPAINSAWRNTKDPLFSTTFQSHHEAVGVLTVTFYAIGNDSIPLLLDAAGEQHPYFADCVIATLGRKFGIGSLDAIEKHMAKTGYKGGPTLVAVLATMKHDNNADRLRIGLALATLATNEDFKTRALVVGSLGDLGEHDLRIIETLQKASNDRQSKQVREAAQIALQKLAKD